MSTLYYQNSLTSIRYHRMPLVGRQRTEKQKAQTAALHKRRKLPKSKAEAIDPANSRLLSEERKNHKRELEKVRRLEASARKRVKRAQEKLEGIQREQATIKEAKEECERTVEELRKEKERVEEELARLKYAHSHPEASNV